MTRTVQLMVFGLFLSVMVALALGQDRFMLKSPNGIGVSEFRGSENRQYVAPSRTSDRVKTAAANPVMIAAHKTGVRAHENQEPDGAKIEKFEWVKKPSTEFPPQVTVPADPEAVEIMVKEVMSGAAVPPLDKYSLKVPGGLAFSEFHGYEDWALVAVHQTEDLLKVIVANPVMIDAYRAGVPANGKPVPDGSKMAKIEWRPKKHSTAPYDIRVPGTIYDLDFMVKDSKRFADSGGWGYAVFVYDATSDMYTAGTLAHRPPQGNDAKCGSACHTIAKATDYVFTEYAKR